MRGRRGKGETPNVPDRESSKTRVTRVNDRQIEDEGESKWPQADRET